MDQNHLHALKKAELENEVAALGDCFHGADLLEIGAGTGYQLSLLAKTCKSTTGVDLPSSNYARDRLMPIIDYDGNRLPFADQSFDVIFTSSVLEHVVDLPRFHQEMHRVLRKEGIAVHIVPTHIWRLWTLLAHYPALPKTILGALKARSQANIETTNEKPRSLLSKLIAVLIPPRHGERGNGFTEIYYFRPSHWERQFRDNGWVINRSTPTGLFQTGYCLFGLALPITWRTKLAKILGSACRTYVLSPLVRGSS
ncbi:MAG TPA: class I SAM-dependent methyltransferase [Sneathiellales bacterium]|nr:class I SAM-dependent methyltransferase [Sneathiellales bacterium]